MRTESLHELLSQYPDIDDLWDFNDLGKTEIKIHEQLAHMTSTEELSQSPKRAELLTQLARLQGLQGKLQEAEATLLLTKELLPEGHAQAFARAELRYLIEQGRFFSLSMNSYQSLKYFEMAWQEAVKLNDVYLLIETSVLLSISQPPKYQNEWLKQALKLAETSGDARGKLWLAQLYVMDGWHSFNFRKFEESLESFKKALEQPETTQNISNRVAVRWGLARTLRSLGRVQDALNVQNELLSEFQAVEKVNGHVFLELAECLLLLKKHEDAKIYFEAAYKELSLNGWYSDNKPSELSRIQYLSKKK